MPKKGKKGKKGKKEKKVDPNALTEVDKTFYELEIADLNRKLARLRSLTAELEEKNEQLKQQLSQLDEDRNDIIAYLKKLLQDKLNEISELTERLRASEEKNANDTEKYESRIAELIDEYNQMHETLTSEIKLLEGKLNSLEEFRTQRDELMRKFEIQEQAMEEQEKRHKQELYEIEKKFIIAKNQLKNDMELRLVQLSQEFHESTELQIAATTHRVIRENIAINNELETMYVSQKKLEQDSVQMKRNSTKWRQEAELHENEKKLALGKVKVQLNLINKLTDEYNKLKVKLKKYETIEKDLHNLKNEFKKQQQQCDNLEYKNHILKQNLENCLDRENVLKADHQYIEKENARLSSILFEAMSSINETLKMYPDMNVSGEDLKETQRYSLINHLFTILNEYEGQKPSKHSLESISSISGAYIKGDLGFVPKPIDELRPQFIETKRTKETQIGSSFDEFLNIDRMEMIDEIEESGEGSSGKLNVSDEEKVSDVFFDESIGEESFIEEEEDEEQHFQRKRGSTILRARSKSMGVLLGVGSVEEVTEDYLEEIARVQGEMDEMDEEHVGNREMVTASATGIVESTTGEHPTE